jgi:hypothetical protein
MATETRTEQKVRIHDEDSGDNYEHGAGPGTPVQEIIGGFYKKIVKRDRRASDRLRCEGSGEDVFQFASLRIGEYLERSKCAELYWLWSGDQGGA